MMAGLAATLASANLEVSNGPAFVFADQDADGLTKWVMASQLPAGGRRAPHQTISERAPARLSRPPSGDRLARLPGPCKVRLPVRVLSGNLSERRSKNLAPAAWS